MSKRPEAPEEVDMAIRQLLRQGVELDRNMLAVAMEPDVAWVKVDKATKRITAIYVKGMVGVTVHAVLGNDGSVEIVNASLDCLCQTGRP
jgi:hypothetical protein